MGVFLRSCVVVLFSSAGCADNGTPQCAVGADCASGMCRADGTCVALPDGGSDPIDGQVPAGDSGPLDGSPSDGAPPPAPDGGGLGCSPNHDGVIARSEIPLRAGLRATFRVATDVVFDTAGEPIDGDRRRWDLTGPFPGDQSTLVETFDPAGQWFEDDFPGATYVTRLSTETDLLGVFAVEADSLDLLGVVSPDDAGFDTTDLENDPAVPALRFPLALGDDWTTTTTVTGLASGVGVFYTERYDSAVDRAGELVTSFGTFEVLRVRTELTRTVGALVTTVVSYAFVSECFGTVAQFRGNDYDTGAELSELAELRRLVP